MGREKYKKQYNSEQKEWIKNNAHIYKTTSEITKAFNKRFETDTPSYTIRSRLEVLFGSEGVREFNGHDRLSKPLFINIEELKEKAKQVEPKGMKWVKNYPYYALYEKVLPTGDVIHDCYNYVELRWLQ